MDSRFGPSFGPGFGRGYYGGYVVPYMGKVAWWHVVVFAAFVILLTALPVALYFLVFKKKHNDLAKDIRKPTTMPTMPTMPTLMF